MISRQVWPTALLYPMAPAGRTDRVGGVGIRRGRVRRVVGERRGGVLWRADSGVSIEVGSGRRAIGLDVRNIP